MLLLENVKGILSQKAVRNGEAVEGTKGHAFTEVLQALHELGYCLEWEVLNSKNWGVPQNRERVFIIGHLGGEPRRKVFPIQREDREDTRQDGQEIGQIKYGKHDQDQLYQKDGLASAVRGEGNAGHHLKVLGNVNPSGRRMNGNVYEAGKGNIAPTVTTNKGEDHKIINHQFRPESRPSIQNGQSGRSGLLYNSEYSYALSSSPHYLIGLRDKNRGSHEKLLEYSPTLRSKRHGVSVVQPCLTPERIEKRQNGRRMKENDQPMFTLTGQDIHGITENRKRIRKLTPKECWRLQGFPDWAFDRAREENSDTQLYKQAGNAVTVNVIEVIAEKLESYFSKTSTEDGEN